MKAFDTVVQSPSLCKPDLASSISKQGVLQLSGYGIKVSVDRGHLCIEDGIGADRHHCRLPRVGHRLRRLVVIGSDGFISLQALRWLADQNCALSFLERDGRVLATTGPVRSSDSRLRRQQGLAPHSGAAVEIARQLIVRKLEGQERLARYRLNNEPIAEEIAQLRNELPAADTIETIRLIEAQAAAAYWSAWADLEIPYPKSDLRRIPEHWRTFGTRSSPISGSPRLAANPPNAVLNYLYALLEAEATLAAGAVGLDPGLGVLHVDTPYRHSLACDLMEPVRPEVDAYLLDCIQRGPLPRQWFFEQRDGSCRLMACLAKQLSETCPTWARAVAPYAEWVAQILWSYARKPPSESRLRPTTLTQRRRSEGRGLKYNGASASVPALQKVCERCGAEGVSRRFCKSCQRLASSETMAAVAQVGRMVARTPKVSKRVSRLLSDHAVANTWWNPADMPEWLTAEYYAERIQPRLRELKVRQIADTIKTSQPYAALVRSGKRRPHPRHWQALAVLVGFRV